MRLYVQWTKATPADWFAIDLGSSRFAFRDLAKKARPVGGETIDDQPGWVYALCCQGIVFDGYDNYAVVPQLSAGRVVALQMIEWQDDPEDWPPLEFRAQVWTLRPPAPDARLGGRVNTRQALTVYTDDPVYRAAYEGVVTSDGPVVLRPWAEFSPPPAQLTRHGIWTPDPLAEQHVAVRSRRGWREWVDG